LRSLITPTRTKGTGKSRSKEASRGSSLERVLLSKRWKAGQAAAKEAGADAEEGQRARAP